MGSTSRASKHEENLLMCTGITDDLFNADSDAVGLGEGKRFCISNTFPGDAGLLSIGHTLGSKLGTGD